MLPKKYFVNGHNVIANINLSYEHLISKNYEDYDKITEVKSLVDKYDLKSTKYLLKIDQNLTFAKKQTNEYLKNYQIIKLNLLKYKRQC